MDSRLKKVYFLPKDIFFLKIILVKNSYWYRVFKMTMSLSERKHKRSCTQLNNIAPNYNSFYISMVLVCFIEFSPLHTKLWAHVLLNSRGEWWHFLHTHICIGNSHGTYVIKNNLIFADSFSCFFISKIWI